MDIEDKVHQIIMDKFLWEHSFSDVYMDSPFSQNDIIDESDLHDILINISNTFNIACDDLISNISIWNTPDYLIKYIKSKIG